MTSSESNSTTAAQILIALCDALQPSAAATFSITESEAMAARAERDGDPGVWVDAMAAGASWRMLESQTGHRRETMLSRMLHWICSRNEPRSPYAFAALWSRRELLEELLYEDVALGFTAEEVRDGAKRLRARTLRLAKGSQTNAGVPA